MSANAADGAALVAAAVQAAIRERAPRRTVAAVAAAVAGTVLQASAQPTPAAKRESCVPNAHCEPEETGDPAKLLESLRAARRAQRLRKKQRRRVAKQANMVVDSQPDDMVVDSQPGAATVRDSGTAGLSSELKGASVVAAAQVPDATLADGASVSSYNTMRPQDGTSVASDTVSAGMRRQANAAVRAPFKGGSKRSEPG